MKLDLVDEMTVPIIAMVFITLFQALATNQLVAILLTLALSPMIIINHLDSSIPFIDGVTKTQEDD